MIGIRGLTACALLWAMGCMSSESDFRPAEQNSSTSKRDSSADATAGSDQNENDELITKDGVVEKTEDNFRHTGEFVAKTKDEFVARANERLTEMDRKLQEWEDRSKSLTDDARAKWNEEREMFHQRRSEMKQELDKLESASGDAWQDMKAGATNAWKDLVDAFKKSAAHFEKDRER